MKSTLADVFVEIFKRSTQLVDSQLVVLNPAGQPAKLVQGPQHVEVESVMIGLCRGLVVGQSRHNYGNVVLLEEIPGSAHTLKAHGYVRTLTPKQMKTRDGSEIVSVLLGRTDPDTDQLRELLHTLMDQYAQMHFR